MRPYPRSRLFSTASSFSSPNPLLTQQLCQRDYLIQKSSLLMNDIHCVQGQKSYYQNQLQTQLRNNCSEKQRLFNLISDKSSIIIGLQQELERQRKQIRLLTDDYLSIKIKLQSERDHFNRQIQMLTTSSQLKLKQLREKMQAQHLQHIQQVIADINQSCEKKLKLKDQQIQMIKKSRQNLGLQLQKAQQQYRLLLVKQSGEASQQLFNQLRRRDKQQMQRYNSETQYKQGFKKQIQQLKRQMADMYKQIKQLKQNNEKYQNEIQTLRNQNQQLQNRLEKQRTQKQRQKQNNTRLINQKSKNQQLIDTVKITNKQLSGANINISSPLDLQLMEELQTLKQFLDESMIEILLDLFQKSSAQGGKLKSASFNTFEINLLEIKRQKRQLSLVIYASMRLKHILKQHWPASQQYPAITNKQSFIQTCLQESETLKNRPNQQLYRLLELIYRIRNPINHSSHVGTISERTLCRVYDKAVTSGSKIFY